MKIIDIPGGQGSQAWHQHRRDHFNASDAPAMMGVSPYKSRTELLRELATGIAPEVTPETQLLFDDGHRCEALARPVAEKIVGDEFYPIVVANGRLSASLDGATLEGKILFEHKRLNAELRAAIRQQGGNANEFLPPLYRVQMEQQLYCAVDAERVLFMASSWDKDGTLLEERHCWYTPDLELRAKILRGWDQFAEDLSNYKPADAAPVVTAAAQEHLPAVSVQLTGSLAVVSNLQPFGVALRAFVEKIPKKPSTDQEFADTEAACKRLKEAEERLQQAEDAALAGMSDVELMRRTVAELRELARTTRLASEKVVKQRKEQIREEEVRRGADAMRAHVIRLNERLGGAFMPIVPADFPGAIKGLKSLDSVRNAIDTELARAKIEASETADRIEANLKAVAEAGMPHLFADKATLVQKDADHLAAIIAQRKATEQQRIDAERERIRREEEARAQAEVERKAAVEREAAAKATDGFAAVQAADAAPAGGSPELRAALDGIEKAELAPVLLEMPTLTLGAICERFGFMLTTEFVERLGFERIPVGPKSKLYTESQYRGIKAKLIEHLEGLA